MVFKSSKQAKFIAKHPEIFKKFIKAAREKSNTKGKKNKFTEALV